MSGPIEKIVNEDLFHYFTVENCFKAAYDSIKNYITNAQIRHRVIGLTFLTTPPPLGPWGGNLAKINNEKIIIVINKK